MPGAASGLDPGLGAKFQVLSGRLCAKRLTAPSAPVEDTEKTAVFLYSKEKLVQKK
jgi:hypothetical protein